MFNPFSSFTVCSSLSTEIYILLQNYKKIIELFPCIKILCSNLTKEKFYSIIYKFRVATMVGTPILGLTRINAKEHQCSQEKNFRRKASQVSVFYSGLVAYYNGHRKTMWVFIYLQERAKKVIKIVS